MNTALAFPVRGEERLKQSPFLRHARVAPEAARRQMSRITRSEGFARAPRMQRFLEFIVEETLAGRTGQLCEYGIGISVFGRDQAFEPGLDPIVRNDARRLRQKLLEYYQQPAAAADPVIITVPKGSYVPRFTAVPKTRGNQPRQYRLTVCLVRVSDEKAVWSAEHEFGSGDTMRLELDLGGLSTADDLPCPA